MKAFASFIVRRSVAWVVVVVVLGLSAAAAMFASRVVQDDDLLAFLPRGNPEVAGFYEVSDRFGSLDIALVGIEAKQGDVFDPDFLRRLNDLTVRLNEEKYSTLTLTSVKDFKQTKGGGQLEVSRLVDKIPTDDASREALREKVFSRDHVVGNLVSADGSAVMLYCTAPPGAQPRDTALRVRQLVEEHFPEEKKYWGGAPFISTYIYDVTQSDLRKYAPWACLAIALIVLLSFKDLLGTGLSLLSTLLAIVLPLGIMGFANVHTNIVLGSMPVILFALGSAYGVHILTRYYALAATRPREQAMREALVDVGPSVLGSGLTTVFGLLSFVMMDIKPMRTFGIFTALGLTIALVLAMVFIPAVMVISPFRGRVEPSLVGLSRLMAGLSVWVQRRRRIVSIATILLAMGATFYATKVDSRLDTTAFFDEGSPPDEADKFLRRHFGGSQYVQIQIHADMTDAAVLRQVQLLVDRILLVDGVDSVNSITSILALGNEAMEEARRLPTDSARAKEIYAQLIGERMVDQTVTDDRGFALLHVKINKTKSAEVEAILEKIEEVTKATLPDGLGVVDASDSDAGRAAAKHRAEIVTTRISVIAKQLGSSVSSPDQLRDALAGGDAPPDLAAIEKRIVEFMTSEGYDSAIPAKGEGGDAARTKVAKAVAALGPPPADGAALKTWKEKVPPTVGGALGMEPTDPDVDNVAFELERTLGDFWLAQRAKDLSAYVVKSGGIAVPEGAKGERLQKFIGHAVLDLEVPGVLMPTGGPSSGDAARPTKTLVTGLPVLYRGLSDSVLNNQWNSLWFALVLVIGLKALLFRSVTTGILSSIPTLLTLLVMYGGMGLLGVHLDIGTSMLASLIIGAGDDYAVQFLWSWSVPANESLEKAARVAAMENGAGIWTNAVMVAAGFFVLTLGEARPLQNVGGLTAGAMLAAAIATFIVTPLLARRRHYAPIPQPETLETAKSPSQAPSSG